MFGEAFVAAMLKGILIMMYMLIPPSPKNEE
jgi:hypothetical protein